MKLPIIYFDKEKHIKYVNEIYGEENHYIPEFESGIVDAYYFDHNSQSLTLYKSGYKFHCSYFAIGIYLELR